MDTKHKRLPEHEMNFIATSRLLTRLLTAKHFTIQSTIDCRLPKVSSDESVRNDARICKPARTQLHNLNAPSIPRVFPVWALLYSGFYMHRQRRILSVMFRRSAFSLH
jgi:hypothetical protein